MLKMIAGLFLLSLLVGCGGPDFDHPGKGAQTFERNVYAKDLERATSTDLEGLDVRVVCPLSASNSFPTKCKVHEKNSAAAKVSPEQMKTAVKKRLDACEAFLRKYSGNFRLRDSNGDLRMYNLNDASFSWIPRLCRNLKATYEDLGESVSN